MDNLDSTAKRPIRAKKAPPIPSVFTADDSLVSLKSAKLLASSFDALIDEINKAKMDFSEFLKEVALTRELWVKEQKGREKELTEKEEEIERKRKREEEDYDYQTAQERKRVEDEFKEKKEKWEKELLERKEQLARDQKELEELRQRVLNFPKEQEKAVKEALNDCQKELEEGFANEQRLKEQEDKNEKEILNLKISGLTAENARLTNELAVLRKSLDQATQQVKDIAVKVIESGGAPQSNL